MLLFHMSAHLNWKIFVPMRSSVGGWCLHGDLKQCLVFVCLVFKICMYCNSSITVGLGLTLKWYACLSISNELNQTQHAGKTQARTFSCAPLFAEPPQKFNNIPCFVDSNSLTNYLLKLAFSDSSISAQIVHSLPAARKNIFFFHVDSLPAPWGNCFGFMYCCVRPIPRRSIFVCLFASEAHRLNGTG